MPKRAAAAFAIAVLLHASTAGAQAEAVKPSYQGWFASPAPTMTYSFESAAARATLVFVPGGEGRMGGPYSPFNAMLRSLSQAGITSGLLHVVFFDSPVDLVIANHWSAARTTTEHLSRVEDVVRHYKDKYGKPVWLMGHSMGSISVTELYKRLQASGRESLVAGLIVSGGQNGTSLDSASTRLPVLLLHHELDACPGNSPSHAGSLHARLRDAGNKAAELALIRAGASIGGNPCRSGYHMYFGADAEVAAVIERFIGKHLPPPTD